MGIESHKGPRRRLLQLRVQRGREKPRLEPETGFDYGTVSRLIARPADHQRGLIERAFEVSVPDNIGKAFSYGASLDSGRDLMHDELAELCRKLDSLLDRSPEVEETTTTRSITVFGRIHYRVDWIKRRVTSGRVLSDESIEYVDATVGLFRPLGTSFWLRWLLDDLSQTESQTESGQGNLFFTRENAGAHDYWLVKTAYRLLQREPRFQKLRKHDLPRALGLNHEVLAITFHCRLAGLHSAVPSFLFNLVWQHESVFRQVSRENPQLLPLLMMFLGEQKLAHKKDPIAEMRDYFREHGLSDATWRYVARHGSRLFDVALEMASNRSLAACLSFLRPLQAAGLPPPPAPSLARAWFRCYADRERDRIQFNESWNEADPSVVRAVLLEGDARRPRHGFAEFVGEVASVLHWAVDEDIVLNEQQARSGWKWLRRNWLASLDRKMREAKAQGAAWRSTLSRTTVGRFTLIPLTNAADLVEEAIAMRHCVDIYVERCAHGENRLFSIRCTETRKRVATLALRNGYGEGWYLHDLKGYANSPPSPELVRLAVTAGRLYAEREQAGAGETNGVATV